MAMKTQEEQERGRGLMDRRAFGGSLALGAGLMAAPIGLGAQTPLAPQAAPGRVAARFPTEYMPAGRAIVRHDGIAGSFTGAQHALTPLINPDHGLRAAICNGEAGLTFQIKETGYRGIPLFAVRGVEVEIDGAAVAQEALTFTLDNHAYRIADLPAQKTVQWWLFDWATIFVPRAGGFAAGSHRLKVRFTYVSIYGAKPTDLAVLSAEEVLPLQPLTPFEA
ncbi:MAG TPA: DUF6379 domain-containing protein [Novosphingobium sp.]|nr:DUF6379 domain-containing protein [Novosphingobium sp.]HZV08820.1 DUF6379 domain-containing protein [Novosphingobium sp.]